MTSSGLGSSAEAAPYHVDDIDDEQQTEKLVSACNNAVERLSSPTNDSDSIELDSLTRQDRDRAPLDQPSSSPRR